MTSGAYERRECPACGVKGRMTSCGIFLSAPDGIEPPYISGSRCSSCKSESVSGVVVRRGRGAPGREELEARITVLTREIASVESSIKAKQDDLADLRKVLEHHQGKLT